MKKPATIWAFEVAMLASAAIAAIKMWGWYANYEALVSVYQNTGVPLDPSTTSAVEAMIRWVGIGTVGLLLLFDLLITYLRSGVGRWIMTILFVAPALLLAWYVPLVQLKQFPIAIPLVPLQLALQVFALVVVWMPSSSRYLAKAANRDFD